jgi:hypothetical protein
VRGPTPESSAAELPAAPIDSPSIEPSDPAILPPRTVTNPPHAQRSVAHPQPAEVAKSTIAVPSGLLRIGGTGYEPEEMISILFARPNTDYNLLSPGGGARPEPVLACTGPDGSFTFAAIDVSADLALGEYSIMTWAPSRERERIGAGEESKRFLTVIVTNEAGS